MINRFKGLASLYMLAIGLTSSPLNAQTFEPQSTNSSIERDSYGMPIISGGNLASIATSVGLVQSQDRLWQIFSIVLLANGRAAEYFGVDFVDSDILQHQINYTDEEVQDQIDTFFSDKTKTFYNNYVIGLNQHVAEVNAHVAKMPYELRTIGFGNSNPVPEFTLYDILRANQFILQQFSPSSIPSYQLDNLSDLKTLIANFGYSDAQKIFNDIDPTTSQVRSEYTVVPNHTCSFKGIVLEYQESEIQDSTLQIAKAESKRIKAIKKLHAKSGLPKLGSNGQAIGSAKSASGNPMIRITTQPNFNQPSDFYQIYINENNYFRGNYFTIPTFPIVPAGIFNNYGVTIQVGHLTSNDYLFESVNNAVLKRIDTIQVLDEKPITLPIYRSTSGGWVMTNPIQNSTTRILTLRSVYIDKQLRALNAFIEGAFATDLQGFIDTFLNPAWQSDITLLEGEYVDGQNNIAAFHTGGWTKLNPNYDRRLPQGIPQNTAPSNNIYTLSNIGQNPLLDINNPQGYYVAWNSLFKQGAAGSGDTIEPVGINRMYWLDKYISSIPKHSFDDLKNISLRQYMANSNVPFDNSGPDEDADLFNIIFKQRFFKAVNNNPTPTRMKALALLQDFEGNWFEGNLNHVLNSLDVSDKIILASVWVNAVANAILNPYLAGTSREVATATSANPVPNTNAFDKANTLVNQLNTLSRIFNLACDNTLFFNDWLNNQPSIDSIIVNGLDFAIITLGGFNAQPWGAGKRAVYEFENALLGPVQSMNMFNASGFILAAEFTPSQIVMNSILALGESGEILGNPNGDPNFNAHCFDQQQQFTQLKLRNTPPFLLQN